MAFCQFEFAEKGPVISLAQMERCMSLYLSFKEVWRNRGRFFLFSLVIALITILVLFIAALAQGLASANKQYIENLNAELLVFQKNVELSAATSRIGRSTINDIQRIEGVQAAGAVGFSSATVVFNDGRRNLNISLIGVEAGKPGAPPIQQGKDLVIDRGSEAIVDQNAVNRAGVRLGDTLRIKTIQGTQEKFYELRVVGITGPRQYLFQPSIFVPYRTWDEIRPQATGGSGLVELTSNVIAVKLNNPDEINVMKNRIHDNVNNVEVADLKTAIEAIPGYAVQQSTLNTQQFFTLLIGILVIGGFFQIQMLQKIPQIGVLKAIGASNLTVAAAVVIQIVLVTTFGVILGSLVALGLALGLPPSVPFVFAGQSVALAIVALLLIGPLGGLVTVRLAISVEPLIALGLSS
jgi:putative ABC transport system permease protein